MKPLVSIIMPTYNRANFIAAAINSVLQQTYRHWELLVIDDGSDDDTEAVVKSLNDDRIQYYQYSRTGIGGVIKNFGLHKASGELFAFLDSDDLWADTKLQKQMDALALHPDAAYSLCGGYNFREEHIALEYFYSQYEGIEAGDFFQRFFSSKLPGFTQALLFKKECLQKTGLFKEVKAFSDVDFIATLALHFKGVIVYEPLVYRRLHDASYSHPTWIKSYNEGAQLIHDFQSELPTSLFRSALFKLHIHFGEDHLQHNNIAQAVKQFAMASKYKPLSVVPFKKMGKAALALLRTK